MSGEPVQAHIRDLIEAVALLKDDGVPEDQIRTLLPAAIKEGKGPLEFARHFVELRTAAARAYRDLLANRERVEPDYEAGLDVLVDKWWEPEASDLAVFTEAVDAASSPSFWPTHPPRRTE